MHGSNANVLGSSVNIHGNIHESGGGSNVGILCESGGGNMHGSGDLFSSSDRPTTPQLQPLAVG